MKKNILKVLAVMAVIPMLAFAGCSKDEDKTEETTTKGTTEAEAEVDDSLTKIMDKGEFVLGLDASFPPMGFTNEDGEIVGFDIDLAKEVCSRLGVELKLQPIEWKMNVTELNAGNIDCVWNGMSVDETRKEVMNLSEAYMKNKMVFVVKKDSGYKTQADLADKIVAVQNGSTAKKILDESDFVKTISEEVLKDTNPAAFQELDVGIVDSVFVDSIVADYYITSLEKDYEILEEGLFEEEYAIGFRKADQALRDKIQEILSEIKADGKMAEISNEWFGKDVTTVK